MSELNIKSAIEAILFANGDSVPVTRIADALEIKVSDAKNYLKELMEEYESRGGGIMIVRLDDAYQMLTRDEYAPQIRAVMDLRRNTPLSQAAMEVLAVVAYNQPVTKAFVEQVRGVDCSGVIGSLTQKDLIEEKGRLELPGRPLIYGTTENFLRCFGISELSELPAIPEEQGEQLNLFCDEDKDKTDQKVSEELDAMVAATPLEIVEQATADDE